MRSFEARRGLLPVRGEVQKKEKNSSFFLVGIKKGER